MSEDWNAWVIMHDKDWMLNLADRWCAAKEESEKVANELSNLARDDPNAANRVLGIIREKCKEKK